jgi:hypothetical protein
MVVVLMGENYNRFDFFHPPTSAHKARRQKRPPMDLNLHSPPRRLIELRIEHADLDALIDRATATVPDDELSLRRLKKRRLLLRDQIARLEAELEPPEPA